MHQITCTTWCNTIDDDVSGLQSCDCDWLTKVGDSQDSDKDKFSNLWTKQLHMYIFVIKRCQYRIIVIGIQERDFGCTCLIDIFQCHKCHEKLETKSFKCEVGGHNIRQNQSKPSGKSYSNVTFSLSCQAVFSNASHSSSLISLQYTYIFP